MFKWLSNAVLRKILFLVLEFYIGEGVGYTGNLF